MLSKDQNLQDSFLNKLRKDKSTVAIYLVNGIKLQGIIDSFDKFVVILQGTSMSESQMVYKHAISTIAPVKTRVSYRMDRGVEDECNNERYFD